MNNEVRWMLRTMGFVIGLLVAALLFQQCRIDHLEQDLCLFMNDAPWGCR